MAEIAAKRPFGMRDKIGYAFGDLGNDFTFMLVGNFMMVFYTNVMGVSPAIVGTLMMMARFVDAVTDVLMGQIVDRSKPTKDGKFTPWMKRMCVPLAVAGFLVFASYFKDMPMSFKVGWMFVTYLLWGSFCYTAVNIPYGSMASAITNDPDQRAQLSVFRSTGAAIAQLVIGTVTPLLVYVTSPTGASVIDPAQICILAAVYGVLGCICHFTCASLCTERVEIPQNTTKFSLGDLLKSLVTNRSLIGIIIASIFLLLGMMGTYGMAPYIYPTYYGNTGAQASASFVSSIVGIVICAPFSARLAKKFGKKEIGVVGSVISAAAWFACLIVRPQNVWVFVAFQLVANLALGFFNYILWAMITDVIDDDEVRRGVREDGKNYSVYSFARKLAQALSSGMIGGFLTMIGYTNAVAETPSAYPEVLDGMFTVTCLIPIIGMALVALSLIFIYPLNKKRVEANAVALKARQEGK